jgi:hypothetical protein
MSGRPSKSLHAFATLAEVSQQQFASVAIWDGTDTIHMIRCSRINRRCGAKICDEYGVTLTGPIATALEVAHNEAAERKCQPPSSLYITFLLTGSRFS